MNDKSIYKTCKNWIIIIFSLLVVMGLFASLAVVVDVGQFQAFTLFSQKCANAVHFQRSLTNSLL